MKTIFHKTIHGKKVKFLKYLFEQILIEQILIEKLNDAIDKDVLENFSSYFHVNELNNIFSENESPYKYIIHLSQL